MRISYRRWEIGDASSIRHVLHDTWLDAYKNIVPKEDLLAYLDDHYSIDAIRKSMENEHIVGFVSDVDGEVVGCERTFFHQEENRLYVHQLYVLPEYQGYGIGKQLMIFAGERAKTFNLDRVWLGVMVDNTPALLWYQKMGYKISERIPFVMGKTSVDHYIGFVLVDDILLS
jgi:ribosomal protein S18 acetylase RimI-like enzyme